MAIATLNRGPRALAPAMPRLAALAGPRLASVASLRRAEVWYAAFAIYAGAVAAFSGPGNDRWWGIWAAGGYAAAALAARCWRARSGGSAVPVVVSLAGALAAPLAWIATHGPATSDTQVVTRSATLLVQHGSPYLPLTDLSSWIAYNPYLPAMSLFGLPHALGLTGLAGETGLWLSLATLGLFVLASRIGGRRDALRVGAFVTASPVAAFPLALGITDAPVLALLCLTLALLSRREFAGRALLAASVVAGAACALKYTAWPALPVLAALLAHRDGFRAAGRFLAGAIGTAVALVALCAPAALAHPAALVQNTVGYPLGLTHAKSPAQSPLPGHLLASLGPAGHDAAVAMLVLAGVAIAVALVVRPPASIQAAALLIALSLALMFALSPATRFGYFAYPVGLCGWVALALPAGHGRCGRRGRPAGSRVVRDGRVTGASVAEAFGRAA